MILGNQEIKRKSQNWMKIQASIQNPKKNLFLAIAVKTYIKADINVF